MKFSKYYYTQGLTTEVHKAGRAVVKMFYNERGQHIKKESYNTASPFSIRSTDYYALNISGNAMAIYTKIAGGATVQNDLPIYGLSRLGVFMKTTVPTNNYTNYQITDHLGNVRAIIKKIASSPIAAIYTYADYYPFGMPMPNKQITDNNYRYAFQGQEKDPETGMEAFELRLWDGRLGRWLTVDPYSQYDSPYLGMGNNPVSMMDPDGGFAEGVGGGDPDDPSMGGCMFFQEDQGYSQPLSKSILIDFVSKNICPSCTSGQLQNRTGQFFEELFEQYLDNNEPLDNLRVIKTGLDDKFPGDTKNTVQDFLGIKYSLKDKKEKRNVEMTTFYEIENFYELKATKNNIGKGSFDGQLKVQIQAADKMKVKEIVYITTSGIKLSGPLRKYAKAKNVLLTHYQANYTISNNQMKTTYVRINY